MKPIERWQLLNAIVATSVSIVVVTSGDNEMLSVILVLHFLLFALFFRTHWSSQIARILPNAITFIRLGILLLVFAKFEQFGRYWVCILAWLAALADILDGYLARKLKGQTNFGAVFDEETDAYYILLLGLLTFQNGILPWWILLTGIPRYFVLILRLDYQSKQLPSFKVPGARLIAGTSFTLFPFLFVLPEPANVACTGILMTTALLYSFLYESYLYVKNQYYLHHF